MVAGIVALGYDSSAMPLVNDVHSRLNETRVERIVPVDSAAAVVAAVREARAAGRAVSIAGSRHAMGGQQFGTDTVLLDLRPLRRVLAFDPEAGTVEAEAGIEWPELMAGYLALQGEHGWGIAQKQTGADRLTLGGSIAVNGHGRGLALRPLIGDAESFTLIDADGEVRRCSRSEDPELFRLAIGGYGLFGVITSVVLRLTPRRKLERVVELGRMGGLMAAFEERIGGGFLYGDFQFSIDDRSPDFLDQGVFSCYRPVDPETPIPEAQRELSDEDWKELLWLAHADKSRAFDLYARYYLGSSGQIYWSDTHQLTPYFDGYHAGIDRRLDAAHPGTEMIGELYVPRQRLADFMAAAAEELRRLEAEVIYGTVRLIERDGESVLAWAREPWACIVFNLCVAHTPEGKERAAEAFRALTDLAMARGGSYFLTYHRWVRRDQVEACHPRLRELLAAKQQHDPEERFQSDWYRFYREMLA
ncbi:MAG TPA: FAD-binding oxidoreductase [Thermoanaerobaculia bacterium]|jgi:FAD/FMN-containing dehydrogenase|nr:FAD-binding oxidoreductase [Thermoanaerobaculia bacterium]